MPYLADMAPFLGIKEKGFGMQLFCAYFGPYGRREIEEPLKIPSWRTKLFYDPFCISF